MRNHALRGSLVRRGRREKREATPEREIGQPTDTAQENACGKNKDWRV